MTELMGFQIAFVVAVMVAAVAIAKERMGVEAVRRAEFKERWIKNSLGDLDRYQASAEAAKNDARKAREEAQRAYALLGEAVVKKEARNG